ACLRTKESLSICEDEVNYATRMDTIVSCSAATWICSADPSCAAALDYYHIFCTSCSRAATTGGLEAGNMLLRWLRGL
ncbi:Uncharacterized protein FKW44_007217, partial [Caligus rogercresseyi]